MQFSLFHFRYLFIFLCIFSLFFSSFLNSRRNLTLDFLLSRLKKNLKPLKLILYNLSDFCMFLPQSLDILLRLHLPIKWHLPTDTSIMSEVKLRSWFYVFQLFYILIKRCLTTHNLCRVSLKNFLLFSCFLLLVKTIIDKVNNSLWYS